MPTMMTMIRITAIKATEMIRALFSYYTLTITKRLRPSLSSNIALRCLREKLRLLIPYYIDE